MAAVNDLPLCVGCFHQFNVARTLEFRLHAIHLNHAAAEMDYLAPIGLRTPRIEVPDIPRGPTILNHIELDNSVVGALNTGTVHSIDVTVSVLQGAGDKTLSEALKILAEAVANTSELNTEQKNETLQQVSFVGEQARCAAEERRPGILMPTLKAIGTTASTVGGLASAWDKVEPLIRAHFGF